MSFIARNSSITGPSPSKALTSVLRGRRRSYFGKQNSGFFAFYLLLLFQVLDAVLTYVGVMSFGTGMEGNPMIRVLMDAVGPFAGILIVKSLAVVFIICLWNLRDKVRWISKATVLLSIYYLFFAILPWSFILNAV
jgi:hypothetical protein